MAGKALTDKEGNRRYYEWLRSRVLFWLFPANKDHGGIWAFVLLSMFPILGSNAVFYTLLFVMINKRDEARSVGSEPTHLTYPSLNSLFGRHSHSRFNLVVVAGVLCFYARIRLRFKSYRLSLESTGSNRAGYWRTLTIPTALESYRARILTATVPTGQLYHHLQDRTVCRGWLHAGGQGGVQLSRMPGACARGRLGMVHAAVYEHYDRVLVGAVAARLRMDRFLPAEHRLFIWRPVASDGARDGAG